MARPAVYVASPLGFSEPGRRYAEQVLLPALVAAGLAPLDPWADPDGSIAEVMAIEASDARRMGALRAMNRTIGARNVDLIEKSVLVLAILDGADIDSGTAGEIGFAAALGHPVVGLRTDTRIIGDNEASVVNLQVAYFIERSGGAIFHQLAEAVGALVALAHPT